MFHVKNHKQLNICDPWAHLGPKRRKVLERSWAGLFQKKILPGLPVEALRKHYHDWNGRPTKELHSMIGLMILQQMHDLTDDQAVEQFCFNIQWHFALNITNTQDVSSYVSHKTLWSMREILSSDGIYDDIFERTLKTLAKHFKADLAKQRMDSVHIQSNMRHLGRIGLFVKTIKKFLCNLKRQHRPLFEKLDSTLTKRYMSKKEESLFAMVKPSESVNALDQLAEDTFILVERFASAPRVNDMVSLKLLIRLFKEQCVVEENEHMTEKKVVARPNKEVPSDSLQNPSDPDAGYSGHKGQGYQVQVVENYSTSDEKQLSLITHVTVESADRHDTNALVPALDDLQQKDMAPKELLADSLYGSESNCEKGRNKYEVEVIAPAMPGNRKKMHLAEFTIDDHGSVVSCPEGIMPERVKKNKSSHSAAFAVDACRDCPVLKKCPVTKGKKAYYYRYKEKDLGLAARVQYEQTKAFKDRYRFRAGVEATMSEFDRRTGVKHLRVRGIKAVRFAAVMKAIGLNILRASRFRKRQHNPERPHCGTIWALIVIYELVKERITRQSMRFTANMKNVLPIFSNWPETAF